ncbi:hypothetical protein HZC31_05840 [Candidatus Woesearchaeota archaeon]|nr:hypothetical protein [Candidatus Woesearchaeota archaeon]
MRKLLFIPFGIGSKIIAYNTLLELKTTLTQHVDLEQRGGRRSILVYANRCNLIDLHLENDTVPSYNGKTKGTFFTSFLSEDYDSPEAFASRWHSLKKEWETLKRVEEAYASDSFEKYKDVLGNDLTSELETIVKEIMDMRKEQFPSAVLAVREVASVLEQTGDLVVLVSNPVDITTAVYAAVSGRDPETVFCPVDNDRLRLRNALGDVLAIPASTLDTISAVGPHDHWNMLVEERILKHTEFSSLAPEKRKEFLRSAEVHANRVALTYAKTRSRTATDYEEVLFHAVTAAMDSEMSDLVKLTLYDPNHKIFTGWMGRIGNMRAVREGIDVVLGNHTSTTQQMWETGTAVVKGVIDELTAAEIIPPIDDKKSGTYKQTMLFLEQRPRTYTTEIDDHAMKRQRLGKGEYFVTTYYQGNNPHLAFMKQDGNLFTVVSLVPLESNKIPRALAYDSETKELYSAHRSGIDVLRVTQLGNSWREVLRLSELPELTKGQKSKRDDIVGVTSLLLNEKELFFTVPGYGIGAIGRERRSPFFSWDAVARYSTNAHIDALQLLRSSSSDGLYVALSGNTLIIGDGREWKAYPVTDGTLEALVGTKDALFGFATMDHAIEVVEWSRYGSPTSFAQSAGGIKQKQRLAYKPTESRLERGTTPLETAVGYRKRLKAAANSEGVIAVLYDGTPFFAHGDHGDFSPLPKIPLVTYVSSREGIGVDALHTIASGFVISGFSTKCLRFAGDDLVHDTISGFGYYNGQQSNPARYMATITI